MRFRRVPITVITATLSVFSMTAQADNGYPAYNRAPNQPDNPYWQAPNWPDSNPPAAYRRPGPTYNYPAPGMSRNMPPAPAAQNQDRGDPPPPTGPYQSAPVPANKAPSALNTPGYNPYRGTGYNPYRGKRKNTNKFWGRSGPGSWMNPNKGNMERGWDDMINSPSRMGKMPGGWNAPEVTMPNPVDIGDQMQDNVQDLPDQMRNMDVGDDIK